MLIRSVLCLNFVFCTLLLAQSEADILLPPPSGTNSVGTLVWHWVDESRLDEVTTEEDDHREITVQVWYPAQKNNTAPPSPYAPYYQDRLNVGNWSSFKPELPQSQGLLPVIVIAPGRGMPSHFYTYIAEDLASHGYFVMAVNSPHSGRVAYPDGRIGNARMEALLI